MKSSFLLSVLAALGLGMSVSVAQGISSSSFNDFEDGTTQGWTEGGPSPNKPTNETTGGPAGVDDSFLENVSSGAPSTAGGRLVMYTGDSTWTGDYLAAGITVITLDANPIVSPGDGFHIRLAFSDVPTNDPFNGTWFITEQMDIAQGSGWQQLTFDLSESNMSRVGGTASYTEVFSGVQSMRIMSSTVASFIADVVPGTLGVDNIRAVPEPSAISLLVLGATFLLRQRRR